MTEASEAPPLPAAYAGFSDVLARLSAPMLQALQGPLVQFERLASRVGAPRAAEQGEFEGLDGLAHRGDLTQLVQSELLLRTEAPLEFLRRLAEGESVFHAPRYADPGARDVYRVMVSLGPGSLGHGRILALAALFFLARVAAQRGADFHWCMLPSRGDDDVWFEGLNVNNVKRMLRTAADREMDAGDIAAARRSAPAREGATTSDILDWRIGSTGALGRPDRRDDIAGHVLGYRLDGPRRGAPRTAEARLAIRGGAETRVEVTFPDDRVCVSALKTPFRPLEPSRSSAVAIPGPLARRPEAVGWAPEGFLMASGREIIVRLHDGLLFLALDAEGSPHDRWILPLRPDISLAGVHWNAPHLNVVTYDQASQRFAHAVFVLGQGRHEPPVRHSPPVDARQLFRNQPPRAIPVLPRTFPTAFFSTSGLQVDLPALSATSVKFAPQYKAPRVVWAGGGRVMLVRDTTGPSPVLRLLKTSGDDLLSVPEGDGPDGGRLFGVTYTNATRALAFSRSPGVWTLVDHARDPPAGATTVRLATHERVVATRPRPDGGVGVTVWSDARLGGDGGMWSLAVDADGQSHRRKTFNIGDDALDILQVRIGDMGTWSLSADADGEAAELRWHRPRLSTPLRINLADEVALAKALSIGTPHA